MVTSLLAVLAIGVVGVSGGQDSGGPVAKHGRMQVKGSVIEGAKSGVPVSVGGPSFFWSQWMGQFYTAEAVSWVKKDWKAGIVRAAVGISGDGYLANPEAEKKKARAVIDAAIKEGIYVIIDWHDHHADRNEKLATEFFTEMAKAYGDKPNVIYEIWNEPVGQISWADVVKPYSERMVKAIRAVDPDNLILVGSPHWCQWVDVAAADPVKDGNVALSLHFYAGTHKADLRERAEKAMALGSALLVSEWGTCNADGDGPIDHESVKEWTAWMKKHHMSWCNWSIADKVEGTAVLKPGASGTGGWGADALTPSGVLVRDMVRGWGW